MEALGNAISPDTVAEWVFYTVLWIAAAIILAKVYSNVQTKKLKEEYKLKHEDINDAQRNALKLLMRDRMSDQLDKFKEKQYVTDTEFVDVLEHYDTYKNLYGNSTGDTYFEEIKEIHKKACRPPEKP